MPARRRQDETKIPPMGGNAKAASHLSSRAGLQELAPCMEIGD